MKMSCPPRRAARLRVAAVAVLSASAASTAFAQYDAPTTYYNAANGQTGASLKSSLQTIVTSMDGVNYGDARYSAPYTDPNPSNASQILLIYNRASVSPTWDEGDTWNREHIWPVSHLGVGNPSNTTTNIATDQHNLRPSNPVINSTRNNNPFGPDGGGGAAGLRNSDTVWYPGDADAGDVSRSLFYMATRYSQLSLVDSITPGAQQMGDLSSLMRYHYKDVPDAFERRRNHAIYGLAGATGSPPVANPYRQENRNPYVDRPEFAWSVFMDQQNDTRLTLVGGTTDANAGSTLPVNLGRVLRFGAVPAAQAVTLSKGGVDGTYYSVTPGGEATSNVTGRYNAFAMDAAGNRTLVVGLNTTTITPGLRTGTVTIDNLDITTGGGIDRGANDANDVVNVSLSVLDASNSSFTGGVTDTNVLTLDFGDIQPGVDPAALPFNVFNLASATYGASLTAGLDRDGITGIGDTSLFATSLLSFTALAAGNSQAGSVTFDAPLTPGEYDATYTLNFSDENLPGTVMTSSLTLNVIANVVPEPATMTLAIGALLAFGMRRGQRH